jgi:hypothetical protein
MEPSPPSRSGRKYHIDACPGRRVGVGRVSIRWYHIRVDAASERMSQPAPPARPAPVIKAI